MRTSPSEPQAESPKPRAESQKLRAESNGSQSCDHCGSDRVQWVKCKLICGNCHQIVKSCADL